MGKISPAVLAKTLIAELDTATEPETRTGIINRLGELDGELFGLDRRPDHPVRQEIEDVFHRLLETGSAADKAVVGRIHPAD